MRQCQQQIHFGIRANESVKKKASPRISFFVRHHRACRNADSIRFDSNVLKSIVNCIRSKRNATRNVFSHVNKNRFAKRLISQLQRNGEEGDQRKNYMEKLIKQYWISSVRIKQMWSEIAIHGGSFVSLSVFVCATVLYAVSFLLFSLYFLQIICFFASVYDIITLADIHFRIYFVCLCVRWGACEKENACFSMKFIWVWRTQSELSTEKKTK